MGWFVFYPICDITSPLFACSNGWVVYFLIGVFTVLSFENLLLPVAIYLWFLLFTLYFEVGLPWYEILWHLVLGYAVGLDLILFTTKRENPLKLDFNLFADLSKTIRLTLAIFTLFFAFYSVDEVIVETGYPYGLALAMLFSVIWVLVMGSLLFCVEKIGKSLNGKLRHYWIYWTWLMTATVLTFLVAFIPTLSSYYKSLIAAVLVFSVLKIYDYSISSNDTISKEF